MNSETLQKLYNRKESQALYVSASHLGYKSKRIYQSKSSFFYVMITVLIFLCLAAVFNIGLKIQSINYGKKIFEINELISIEKERSDRLGLKISELKSPERIITRAEASLGMKFSDNLKIIQIKAINANDNKEMDIYVENIPIAGLEKYNSFLGTIYSIRDIVMVVSESVLTFFIP